jgi:hypothetical protein
MMNVYVTEAVYSRTHIPMQAVISKACQGMPRGEAAMRLCTSLPP